MALIYRESRKAEFYLWLHSLIKAETPELWPPHAKSWLSGKDSDAGRDWGQEEKGTTEDEMAGWHHWVDGRESEWTPGVRGGQGGLVCWDSWGCKESDTTEWLNWTELNLTHSLRTGFSNTLCCLQIEISTKWSIPIIFKWGLLCLLCQIFLRLCRWKSHQQQRFPKLSRVNY